jgi:hypothetical protein
MCTFGKAALLSLLAGLRLTPEIRAQTDTNVVVAAFTTTNSTPLNPGFIAASLSPAWLLFPAGTTGDAFDWSSGLTVQSWMDEIVP